MQLIKTFSFLVLVKVISMIISYPVGSVVDHFVVSNTTSFSEYYRSSSCFFYLLYALPYSLIWSVAFYFTCIIVNFSSMFYIRLVTICALLLVIELLIVFQHDIFINRIFFTSMIFDSHFYIYILGVIIFSFFFILLYAILRNRYFKHDKTLP